MTEVYTPTPYKSLYAHLENGMSPAKAIDFIEKCDVRIDDDFGRHAIAPREEDRAQLRAALREYIEKDAERKLLGYTTLSELAEQESLKGRPRTEIELAHKKVKEKVYKKLPPDSFDYWNSMDQCVYTLGVHPHKVNILIRTWLDTNDPDFKGTTPNTDLGKSLADAGKNEQKRIYMRGVLKEAEKMILGNKKRGHDDIARELYEKYEKDYQDPESHVPYLTYRRFTNDIKKLSDQHGGRVRGRKTRNKKTQN